VEAAIREAERLLARPLIKELTDPDTGEITPIRLISDNGPCYRSGGFAAYIRRWPELVHIRTRYRSPQTNGVVERYIDSAKYEHLYRTDITDGLALALELDAYRDIYNRVRPHEALAFATPLDRYLTKTPTYKWGPTLNPVNSSHRLDTGHNEARRIGACHWGRGDQGER
jgi:putative transposase